MRILGSAVLAMESLTMGFAILIAMKNHSGGSLIVGGLIAILLLLSAGLLKKKFGWIIASVLQVAMLSFSFVVPSFIWIGAIFVILWVLAIVVGRKGESIRRKLMENPPKNLQ